MMLFRLNSRRIWRVGGGVVHDRPVADVLNRVKVWLQDNGIAFRVLHAQRQESYTRTVRDCVHIRYDDILAIANDTHAVLFRLAFPEARVIDLDETVGVGNVL